MAPPGQTSVGPRPVVRGERGPYRQAPRRAGDRAQPDRGPGLGPRRPRDQDRDGDRPTRNSARASTGTEKDEAGDRYNSAVWDRHGQWRDGTGSLWETPAQGAMRPIPTAVPDCGDRSPTGPGTLRTVSCGDTGTGTGTVPLTRRQGDRPQRTSQRGPERSRDRGSPRSGPVPQEPRPLVPSRPTLPDHPRRPAESSSGAFRAPHPPGTTACSGKTARPPLITQTPRRTERAQPAPQPSHRTAGGDYYPRQPRSKLSGKESLPGPRPGGDGGIRRRGVGVGRPPGGTDRDRGRGRDHVVDAPRAAVRSASPPASAAPA